MALVVKNLTASSGEIKDEGSTPGLGRFPGRSHGSPLQYSCLENSMDRGAWKVMVHRITVHRVAKNQTQLKQLGTWR